MRLRSSPNILSHNSFSASLEILAESRSNNLPGAPLCLWPPCIEQMCICPITGQAGCSQGIAGTYHFAREALLSCIGLRCSFCLGNQGTGIGRRLDRFRLFLKFGQKSRCQRYSFFSYHQGTRSPHKFQCNNRTYLKSCFSPSILTRCTCLAQEMDAKIMGTSCINHPRIFGWQSKRQRNWIDFIH